MNIYIKNLSIIICYIYSYLKMCNNQIKTTKKLGLYVSSVLIAAIISLFDNENAYSAIPILFIVMSIILYLALYEDHYKKLINLFLSFSIVYVIYAITVFVFSILYAVFPLDIRNGFGQVLWFAMRLFITIALFKIKRTRNAIKSLNNTIYVYPVIFLGMLIFAGAIYLSINKGNVFFRLVFLVLLCVSIAILLYFRYSITKRYLDRLSIRDIDSLNAELREKNKYIEAIMADKKQLEKINHKNYKLVPAMQGAVMHYLNGMNTLFESIADNPAFTELAAAKEMDITEYIKEGNKLIEQLETMNEEWADIVNNEGADTSRKIDASGVRRVDYILSYMYERAQKEGRSLSVNMNCSLKELTDKLISEEDLATLMADLIENAIIATGYNDGKDILVNFGMVKKEYVIDVYDSGIPFDREVLLKYGRQQITTHADDRGNGIGMMQTYEILSKCGASLFIDELSKEEGLYTKKLSVVFNRKHQYVLYTNRDDEDIAYLKKRADLTVMKK